MKRWRNYLGFAAAPLFSAVLIAGIAVENATHLTPTDVEPYHHRAQLAVLGERTPDGRTRGGVPRTIGSWYAKDEDIPKAAQELLKPNAILSRTYSDASARGLATGRAASLLIVQCRDTRDMGGHYPPICYPAHGQVLVSATPKDWVLPRGLLVKGTAYEFAKTERGETSRRVVYNFIILPGPTGQIIRDIKGVNRVSEDYQQRYYGAAQFQLVMPAAMSEAERDQIFQEIVGANESVIEALKTTVAVKL